VRVFGAQLVRQVNHGQAGSVFGTYHPAIAIDTQASLSEDDALARAKALTGGVALQGAPPELVVLPEPDGTYVLAWYLRVLTRTDLIALFIDATSGAEAFRYSDLKRDAAVGTAVGVLGDRKKISTNHLNGVYYAEDKLRPAPIITYDLRGNLDLLFKVTQGQPLGQADIASDADNDWNDGAAVDAQVYLGYVYDYYLKRFGLNGLGNRNLPMMALVHPVYRDTVGLAQPFQVDQFYTSASWCGGCGAGGIGYATFDDGLPPGVTLTNGQSVKYISGALDIVGHELTHGVTQYAGDFNYFGESGALDEAFSDIMGTSIEFYYQPPGNGPQQADYLIGEDVYVPSASFALTGLLSLANPRSFAYPDHYSIRFTAPDPRNVEVHSNSTIASHAFYLAIEGGTNRTSGLSVQGVGAANRDQIEKVFFRAFTALLPPDATFAVARRATLQAAIDLYGTSSAAYRAVNQAWDAVGVF
jgi:bacillolysin